MAMKVHKTNHDTLTQLEELVHLTNLMYTYHILHQLCLEELKWEYLLLSH